MSFSETHQASTPDQNVVVGRVVGASGLRGELKVEILSDVPDRFAVGAVLYLDGEKAHVEKVRSRKGGVVVKLDVVKDRTQAESRRGSQLTVPESDARPLEEGSYYHFQIVDIDVWTDAEEHLGKVTEILATGSNDVYVVRDAIGREVLVPALKDVVREVDLGERRMVVRLPEGLDRGAER